MSSNPIPRDIMNNLSITQIKNEDRSKIEKLLTKIQNKSFWCCFLTIQMFLNTGPKRAYFFKDKLICERKWLWGKDYRLLFTKEKNDEQIIEGLVHEKPEYIGYAFMQKIPSKEKRFVRVDELQYDLEKIVSMEGPKFKNLRNSYTYIKRKYPNILVKDIFDYDSEKIKDFFFKWKKEKETLGIRGAHTESDIYLINNFFDKNSIFGTIVEINNKIYGIEISSPHPFNKEYCVNIIRKTLPSFKQGGEFLQVKHAKKCIEKGHKIANDGPKGPTAQAKFKMKLHGDALPLIPTFAQTIYMSDKLKKENRDISFMYTFPTVS